MVGTIAPLTSSEGARTARRGELAISAGASLLILAALVAAPARAGGTPGGFGTTGLDGAGFVNVVAFDPLSPNVVIAGGDVSGIQRSTDGGRTWRPANVGVQSTSQLRIASLAFSPTVPGEIYAGVGLQGTGGGFLVSVDDGLTWSLRSTAPQFSGGNNAVGGLPSPHPRSTGTLIAVDGTHGFLYAATFKDGVMRSADDGASWTTLGLAGKYLRSLAMDPVDPNVLYASTYGNGVWKTTSAGTDGTFAALAGSPASAEDLAFVGSDLYAAAGLDGLLRSADGGATWMQLGAGQIPTGGPTWFSIAGYQACGQTVLYAGGQLAGVNSVMTSADGGQTWASLTASPAGIHTTIAGPAGSTWWLAGRPETMLAGSTYVAAQIAIDPGSAPDGCQRQHVLVAGRSGVWGTTDAGADWYPMVGGLAVTIVRALVADPTVPGRVYVAPADWGFLYSTDAGTSVVRGPPSKVNDAFGVAVDGATSPGTVYIAAGQASANAGGEIWSDPDPASGGTWTSLGLGAADAGRRPLAVAVNRVSGAPVVLAAVEGSGIWRRATGSWTRVNSVAMGGTQTTKAASFSWPPGSSTAYLYDRKAGVWRSNDAGQTWTQIWNAPSPPEMTGYVAADPRDPSRLFVSVGNDGLYRLDGATSGTVEGGGITPAPIGSFPAPGPIDVGAGGTLVATELPDGTARPGVLTSNDAGATWTPITDAAYAAAGGFARSISLGPDGAVWVGLNGDGMLVRIPPTPQYVLSAARAGTGGGTVTSAPGGIDCGATCSASFAGGTSVDLTATPDASSIFTGWSGDCAGTSAVCTIAVNGARTATATFVPATYPLSVAASGSGTGIVSSSPAGINCGTTCVAGFPNGSQVTLTAVPAANATFSGWTGDCSGAATCTLTMTSAKSATATFALVTYPLTVARAGTGSGTVTSAPAGIACGGTCTASFTSGTGVTLTAAPGAGSLFSGWSGDCSGATATCTVTMTAARSTTATFLPAAPRYRPDGWIKLHTATSYVGDGVYSGTGTGETVSVTIPRGTSQTFDIAVQNDGSVADAFLVKGAGSTSRMQVRYYSGLSGTTDITSLVTAGGYSTSSLAPGASVFIRLVVTVKSDTSEGTVQSWLVTASSKTQRSNLDAVKAQVTSS